jgi:hypothetical protein
MSDEFKFRCKRRTVRPEQFLGAGSGGDDGDGSYYHYFDGGYTLGGSQVTLHAIGTEGEGTDIEQPVISLLAGGSAPDGRIYMHGSQGVRVTSGPPGQPKSGHKGINGVEVVVGETQSITLDRGLVDGVDQHIQMDPGLIVADGGSGTVALLSTTQITLSVAGGTSSIVLTPQGIVMQGPIITLN